MKEIPASPQHVICQPLTIIQCLIKYVTFYDQFPYTNSKYITYFMTLFPGSRRFSFSAHNLKKKSWERWQIRAGKCLLEEIFVNKTDDFMTLVNLLFSSFILVNSRLLIVITKEWRIPIYKIPKSHIKIHICDICVRPSFWICLIWQRFKMRNLYKQKNDQPKTKKGNCELSI